MVTALMNPVQGTVSYMYVPDPVLGGFHPHRILVLTPSYAYTPTATGVVVDMHGGTGNPFQQAYYKGVLKRYTENPTANDVNWDLLANYSIGGFTFPTIAMFPTGQARVGAGQVYNVNWDGVSSHLATPRLTYAPGANPYNPFDYDTTGAATHSGNIPTWSNGYHSSGVNDGGDDGNGVLDHLSLWINANINPTVKILSGHSDGGAMTRKMWWKAPGTFDKFICLSGPPSGDLFIGAALPGTQRDTLDIFGGGDNIIGAFQPLDQGGDGLTHWYDSTWPQYAANLSKANVDYPNLTQWLTPWVRFSNCSAAKGTPQTAGVPQITSNVVKGQLLTYQTPDNKQRLQILTDPSADHKIPNMSRALGSGLYRYTMAWVISTLVP